MPRKASQADRLLKLLSDGVPHSTVEVMERVYGGEHVGLARVGACIYDLKERGHAIESLPDPINKAVWFYHLKNPPVAPPKLVPIEVMKDGIRHIRFVPEGPSGYR